MLLKVVPHEETVFSIQKICISNHRVTSGGQSGTKLEDGRYACIAVSETTSCLCKLFIQQKIHPAFVYLDASVIHFKTNDPNSLPRVPLVLSSDLLRDSSIELLPQITNIKSLCVSVVLEHIKDIKKFKENEEKLLHIVNEQLKLFTVVSNCVVFLRNLKESLRHGIHAIVVHSASQCKKDIVPGRVTSATTVSLCGLVSKLRFEQVQKSSCVSRLGGLEAPANLIKDLIRSNISFKLRENRSGLRPSQQVLLTGPPGCGKTSIVHQVAADCCATLLTVSGPEAVTSKPGATEEALREIFKDAFILANEQERGVCILLLDEVDTLCPRRDISGSSSHSARATVQLLSLLEQASTVPGLVVIATTNKSKLLDPSVRRPGRLETEVYIGVPTEQERESILQVLMEPMAPPDLTSLSRLVASLTPGYVGADLALVCQEVALMNHRRKSCQSSQNEKHHKETWISDFKSAVIKTRPSALRSGLGVIELSPLSLDSIGGLEDVKRELRVAVEWPLTHPEAFVRLGLRPPKGILLYGPPGCAKTSLARALASATSTTFLAVSAADLYSPYVGEAERSISELFQRARTGAPSIVFIDEIDALVGCRGDRERGVQERVLSALLTEMDGVGVRLEAPKAHIEMDQCLEQSELQDSLEKESVIAGKSSNCGVLVIAATNRPDMLDDALLRPGRFDKLIYVPAPNNVERLDILKRVTSKMPLANCVDLVSISEHSNLFSGADLSHLCKEAALNALTKDGMSASVIKHCHFEAVLKELRPSLTEEQLSWYITFKEGM